MNQQVAATPNQDDGSLKHKYLTFKDAEVLWPPECPDDILEQAIQWAKTFQKECKGLEPEDKENERHDLDNEKSPKNHQNLSKANNLVNETNYEWVSY